MLQPVLDDLELQGAHRADDLASVEVGGEELGHTLVHQLIDALCQLLELQRVGVLDVAELLGREGGMPVNFSFSPSVKVSPMAKLPVSCRPTMSPG